jgi:proliferating cell nuclear antigen
VNIELDKDYPLNIRFEIAEGKGRVDYLLAPRIESD